MWRAFTRLRTTRVNGMGLGRIPWHEAHRWADHQGLDDEETESLCDLIELLDIEEIDLSMKEAKKQEAK